MRNTKNRRLVLSGILLISILSLLGCFLPGKGPLGNIDKDSFIYCLQSIGYEELMDREFDIAVIDIDDSGLTSSQLKDIQKRGDTVLSYLSIGEAEDYRIYWKEDWQEGQPSFIYEENPFWEGNYKVKYWDRSWRNIVTGQLDRIIERGFDGVYLDVIDAYAFFKDLGFDHAEEEMIGLVKAVSLHAREKDKDFLIIAQNAEELTVHKGYLDSIDGVGREELFFESGKSVVRESAETSLDYLKKLRASGKYVFIISYTDKPDGIKKVIDTSLQNGFYYFIGSRELDSLDCRTAR